MGIRRFFREINQEADKNVRIEFAAESYMNIMNGFKEGRYPSYEDIKRYRGVSVHGSFDSYQKGQMAFFTLNKIVIDFIKSVNEGELTSYSLIETIVDIFKSLYDLDYENDFYLNDKEYLTNDEFLEKYKKFSNENLINTYRSLVKYEILPLLAIRSYIDTTVLLSGAIKNIFKDFQQKEEAEEVHLIYDKYDTIGKCLTSSVIEMIKKRILGLDSSYIPFYSSYRYHGQIEANSDLDTYKNYLARWSDRFLSPSFTELEKELRLFYIDDIEEDFVDSLKDFRDLLDLHMSFLEGFLQRAEEKATVYKSLQQGKEGEDYVYSILKEYLPSNWIILRNINVPYKDGKRENDLIVLCEKGVFTIEVKNYKAGSITITNDGNVIHDIGNGQINKEKNMIEQSESHVIALCKFLEENYPIDGIKWYELVKGIVVISNKDMEINNESNYPIYRTALVRDYFTRQASDQLKEKEIEDIRKLLIENSLPDTKREYMPLASDFMNEKYLKAIQNSSKDFMNIYLSLLENIDEALNIPKTLMITPTKKPDSLYGFEIIRTTSIIYDGFNGGYAIGSRSKYDLAASGGPDYRDFLYDLFSDDK